MAICAVFVDRIKIFAQAGKGGRGCVSFRREKFVPKGGPDGGDGGRGGDVILRADQHTDHLAHLFYEPIIKAKNGGHGRGKKMHGKNAPNKIVKVPVGTIIYQLQLSDERSTRTKPHSAIRNPQFLSSLISAAMVRSFCSVREASVGKVTCILKARATALRASIPMEARVRADIFFSSCVLSRMRRL